MLRHILRRLGWGRSENGKSSPIDDARTDDPRWTFSEVHRPHAFLKWVLSVVPDESIWTVDGVSRRTRKFLSRFRGPGPANGIGPLSWSTLPSVEVTLDAEAKTLILEQVDQWDLDRDFIHQSISHGGTLYFLAYDNLQHSSVSKRIAADQLQALIADGIVSVRGLRFDIASEDGWQRLTGFLTALVAAQRARAFHDIEYWHGFFDPDSPPTFWWQVKDRQFDGSVAADSPTFHLSLHQVLSSLIEQLRRGECEILGWRRLSPDSAVIEYEPWTGLGCVQVLVEAFGHHLDPYTSKALELPDDYDQ